MTKKSTPDRSGESQPVHAFDQTNGVFGEAPSPERKKGSPGSGDVPVATNMLFGGN